MTFRRASKPFSRAVILAGLALALMPGLPSAMGADAVTRKFAQRSVSNSRQFIVYCPDARLRLAVTGYVETAKAAVLSTLGIGDHWKIPIVINMTRPSTTRPRKQLSGIHLSETEEGPKIDIDVSIREEQFKEIHFPQLVVRAVLLEIAYRDRAPVAGERFVLPPSWLVEGIAEQLQARSAGTEPNAALFKTLIDTGRIQKIRDFLDSDSEPMDATSRTVFGACSSSLIEMLVALPDGRNSLTRAVRNLRKAEGDSVNLLLQNFPSLGKSEASLEKWWTLGLARFSASDRYLSMSVAETDARLQPILNLEIVTDTKKGTKTSFTLDDYKKFAKLQMAKPALQSQATALASLLPKAHPLLRPVVVEYQRIATSLSQGKTRGIEESLSSIGNYRVMIVERTDKINDYMNWFEATQMAERSGAFDSYLKTAKSIENAPVPKRDDALSRYVDQVEREFE